MKVTALDLSLTASGVAKIAAGGEAELTTLRPPPKLKGPDRLYWILTQVLIHTEGADLVLIEGYAFGKQTVAYKLGELGGVIRVGLWSRGIPYLEIAPSKVKKLATGKGNAKKDLVLAEAIRRLDYAGADNNQADARWMLAMAQIHFGLPSAPKLPQTHLKALEGIEWPERKERAA